MRNLRELAGVLREDDSVCYNTGNGKKWSTISGVNVIGPADNPRAVYVLTDSGMVPADRLVSYRRA